MWKQKLEQAYLAIADKTREAEESKRKLDELTNQVEGIISKSRVVEEASEMASNAALEVSNLFKM